MKRRDFLKSAAFAAAALSVPSVGRAAVNHVSPFKTVLHKALIRPRLTAAVADELLEAGFLGVELQDKSVTLDEARAGRRLAEDRGLTIHSFMGGWFEFNSKDPEKRAAALHTARENILTTEAYGASVMLVVPGRIGGLAIPSPSSFDLAFNPETLLLDRVVSGDNTLYADYIAAQNEATERAREALTELMPFAAEHGVVLGLENVWNNLWVEPSFAAAFIRSFRSPWVKAYLDLGNSIRYAPTEKWLVALDDQIIKLHIKDFKIDRSKKDDGAFVRIGDGTIDWKRVRRAIEAVRYNGWVSIESSGWTNAEHSEIMDRFMIGAL